MLMDRLPIVVQSTILILTVTLIVISLLVMFTDLIKINQLYLALFLSIYVILLGTLVDNSGGIICVIVGVLLFIKRRCDRRKK